MAKIALLGFPGEVAEDLRQRAEADRVVLPGAAAEVGSFGSIKDAGRYLSAKNEAGALDGAGNTLIVAHDHAPAEVAVSRNLERIHIAVRTDYVAYDAARTDADVAVWLGEGDWPLPEPEDEDADLDALLALEAPAPVSAGLPEEFLVPAAEPQPEPDPAAAALYDPTPQAEPPAPEFGFAPAGPDAEFTEPAFVPAQPAAPAAPLGPPEAEDAFGFQPAPEQPAAEPEFGYAAPAAEPEPEPEFGYAAPAESEAPFARPTLADLAAPTGPVPVTNRSDLTGGLSYRPDAEELANSASADDDLPLAQPDIAAEPASAMPEDPFLAPPAVDYGDNPFGASPQDGYAPAYDEAPAFGYGPEAAAPAYDFPAAEEPAGQPTAADPSTPQNVPGALGRADTEWRPNEAEPAPQFASLQFGAEPAPWQPPQPEPEPWAAPQQWSAPEPETGPAFESAPWQQPEQQAAPWQTPQFAPPAPQFAAPEPPAAPWQQQYGGALPDFSHVQQGQEETVSDSIIAAPPAEPGIAPPPFLERLPLGAQQAQATLEEQIATMRQSAASSAVAGGANHATTIYVTGSHGGAGKTTVSWMLANVVARALQREAAARGVQEAPKVWLIESDFSNPKLAHRIRADRGHDAGVMANLLEQLNKRQQATVRGLQEIKEQTIKQSVLRLPSGLNVVACPYDITDRRTRFIQMAVQQIVEYARAQGGYVFIDSNTLSKDQVLDQALLNMSDRVVLVSDYGHLDDMQRAAHTLTKPLAQGGLGVAIQKVTGFLNKTGSANFEKIVAAGDLNPLSLTGFIPQIPEWDTAWVGDQESGQNFAKAVARFASFATTLAPIEALRDYQGHSIQARRAARPRGVFGRLFAGKPRAR